MTPEKFQLLVESIESFINKNVEKHIYEKSQIPSVKFSDDYILKFSGGFPEMPQQMGPTTIDGWTDGDVLKIMGDYMKDKAEDEEIQSFLSNNSSLVRELTEKLLNNDREGLSHVVDCHRRKSDGEQLYCKAKTALIGVGLDVDEFSFTADLVDVHLRRPGIHELKEFYQEYSLLDSDEFPTLIVEIRTPIRDDDGTHIRALQEEVDILQWILSLVGLGSIGLKQVKYFSEDFAFFHRSSSWHSSLKRNFVYCLTKTKLEHLEKTYANLRNTLIKAGFVSGKLNASQVAYERYRDALAYERFQKQISSAIMGLEAIYTEQGDGISYKLRMRASYLMKILLGRDCAEELKLAYKIRSDYAHGNTKIESLEKNVEKNHKSHMVFGFSILNILRISILMVLVAELDPRKGHVKLLQKSLDEAMLFSNTKIIDDMKSVWTQYATFF